VVPQEYGQNLCQKVAVVLTIAIVILGLFLSGLYCSLQKMSAERTWSPLIETSTRRNHHDETKVNLICDPICINDDMDGYIYMMALHNEMFPKEG